MSHKIGDYFTQELPIERLKAGGPDALTDIDLISVILGTGTAGRDVLQLSRDILTHSKGLKGLCNLNVHDLENIKGIGRAKAARLVAVFEIARRINKPKLFDKALGNSPEAIYEYVRSKFRFDNREMVMSVLLNSGLQIIGEEIISIGTDIMSFAEPKEVFLSAVKRGANCIIICHNHPSGDINPSAQDIKLTKRLIESGTLLGIKVLDHIIIGENAYYSMNKNGII